MSDREWPATPATRASPTERTRPGNSGHLAAGADSAILPGALRRVTGESGPRPPRWQDGERPHQGPQSSSPARYPPHPPPPSCPLAKRLGGHRRQPPPPMKLRCPVAWLWNWVPRADTRSGGARPGWSPQDSRHSGLCYGRDIRPLPQRARSERVLRPSSPTCPHKRRRRGDKAAALQPMKGPGAGFRRIPSGQGGRGHGCARALGAQDWPFPEAPTGLISLAPVLAQDETDQRPEEGGDGGLHQHRDPPRGGGPRPEGAPGVNAGGHGPCARGSTGMCAPQTHRSRRSGASRSAGGPRSSAGRRARCAPAGPRPSAGTAPRARSAGR